MQRQLLLHCSLTQVLAAALAVRQIAAAAVELVPAAAPAADLASAMVAATAAAGCRLNLLLHLLDLTDQQKFVNLQFSFAALLCQLTACSSMFSSTTHPSQVAFSSSSSSSGSSECACCQSALAAGCPT
jgi:hypothetical protein